MLRTSNDCCGSLRPQGSSSGFREPSPNRPIVSSNEPYNGRQCTSQMLSEIEQSHIYYEWIRAGRLHNFVCSACRNPNKLLLCETCCRSYHLSCLPSSAAPLSTGIFYCPSCKEKQWDRSPPRVTVSAPPSDVSRSSSPCAISVDGHTTTSSAHAAHDDRESAVATGGSLTDHQKTPVQSGADLGQRWNTTASSTYQQYSVPPVFDLSNRARLFLAEYGGFHPGQEYRQELLLRLESMMREIESQHTLFGEIQDLREENSRLRSENAQFRAYMNPRPSVEQMMTAASSFHAPIAKPTSDTTGRTWDSIAMDMM